MLIVGGQLTSIPLAEGGRTGADVDSYIKDIPKGNADQLALGKRLLVVQPAYYVAARGGMIILYETAVQPRFDIAFFMPCFHKIAARVAEDFWFNHDNACYGSFYYFHRPAPVSTNS